MSDPPQCYNPNFSTPMSGCTCPTDIKSYDTGNQNPKYQPIGNATQPNWYKYYNEDQGRFFCCNSTNVTPNLVYTQRGNIAFSTAREYLTYVSTQPGLSTLCGCCYTKSPSGSYYYSDGGEQVTVTNQPLWNDDVIASANPITGTWTYFNAEIQSRLYNHFFTTGQGACPSGTTVTKDKITCDTGYIPYQVSYPVFPTANLETFYICFDETKTIHNVPIPTGYQPQPEISATLLRNTRNKPCQSGTPCQLFGGDSGSIEAVSREGPSFKQGGEGIREEPMGFFIFFGVFFILLLTILVFKMSTHLHTRKFTQRGK